MDKFEFERRVVSVSREWMLSHEIEDPGRAAVGAAVAVLLADAGIPVAPFSTRAVQILAEPSADISAVFEAFRRNRGSMVSYDVQRARFDFVVTNCTFTLMREAIFNPRIWTLRREIAALIPELRPQRWSPLSVVLPRLSEDSERFANLEFENGASIVCVAPSDITRSSDQPEHRHIPVPIALPKLIAEDLAMRDLIRDLQSG